MRVLKLQTPTFYHEEESSRVIRGDELDPTVDAALKTDAAHLPRGTARLSEFGPPASPVVVHDADGVRIVLGTHNWRSHEHPDIQIERRRNGWAIFLHPLGGCDPSGYIFFIDDGRSFVVKARNLGITPALEELTREATVPGLDS